jgi:hypothetical protein
MDAHPNAKLNANGSLELKNNEQCEGVFIWIQLWYTRRADDSRPAAGRAATCGTARYQTSVPGEKLVHFRCTKLSHRSTAASISQSTILIANAPSFSIWSRKIRGISARVAVMPRLPAGLELSRNERATPIGFLEILGDLPVVQYQQCLASVRNYFRCGLVQFKSCADFLKARSKRVNLLLLTNGIRLQFLL